MKISDGLLIKIVDSNYVIMTTRSYILKYAKYDIVKIRNYEC